MQIHSQTGLQLDAPHRRPPPSHMPWPHTPQPHGHIAAPVAPSRLRRCPLQLHVPRCHTPRSCMATSSPSPLPAALAALPHAQLHGHGAASLAAAHVAAPLPPAQATLQHAPQLDALCRCPHRSHACCITARLTAAQATSPPWQPHSIAACLAARRAASPPPSQLCRPCRHEPCSWMGHIAARLAAGQATSPPSSQPGMPCRCVPHSWMGHVAASLAAAHATSPCAS
jgi:hypothetical protein